MKVDFSLVLTSIKGTPIQMPEMVKDKDGKEEEVKRDFTLRDAAINGLLFMSEEDVKKLTGVEKIKRNNLADRIWGCKEPINLTSEERVLIKEQINKIYDVRVTAQSWLMIDPVEEEEKVVVKKIE